jgi:hypothetical protein
MTIPDPAHQVWLSVDGDYGSLFQRLSATKLDPIEWLPVPTKSWL